MLDKKHIHFIGVGGIGISALAYLALESGKTVHGSDSNTSAITDDLKANGAEIFVGHSRDNVSNKCDLVIYTEAIDKATNEEYLKAEELGIPTLSYFQALGQLTHTKKAIVVTGTHGKTTTTAMLGQALVEDDLDPTVIVGTKVRAFNNRNIRIGKDDLMVVEGCEYRRSFLSLHPFGVVLLNIELEHVDYYKDEEDYVNAFIELVKQIPVEGFLVANVEDENVKKVIPHCVGTVIEVTEKETKEASFKLQVPGFFNEMNAMQAVKAAEAIGSDGHLIKCAIDNSFQGTWRRLEKVGELKGAIILDDYGHHPTEIKATLGALKEKYPERNIVCIFQPHQYSRTHELLEDFKTSFGDADKVIIPNIYEARDTEEDKKKISAAKLAEAIPNAIYGDGLENTADLIRKDIQEKDLIITMGAGNVRQVAESLV